MIFFNIYWYLMSLKVLCRGSEETSHDTGNSLKHVIRAMLWTQHFHVVFENHSPPLTGIPWSKVYPTSLRCSMPLFWLCIFPGAHQLPMQISLHLFGVFSFLDKVCKSACVGGWRQSYTRRMLATCLKFTFESWNPQGAKWLPTEGLGRKARHPCQSAACQEMAQSYFWDEGWQ